MGNNFTVPYRGGSTGVNNTFLGTESGASNTTGEGNTVLGRGCFNASSTGSYNTALGYAVLQYSTTGNNNTGVGTFALTNCTADDNTALGLNALRNVTSGSNDIAIGHRGVTGESNVIRIGTSGTQTDTYLTGTVHLPAGTATLAPLNLQTGVNLTTPAFGAVEFDGTNLFLTNNNGSPTRKTIAFTDSTITAAQIANNTITGSMLASGAVGSSQLASGLTLGGTTTGTFSGPLTGNASTATSATSFTGSLAGNVTGTQGATTVASVGGSTAANVHAAELLANAATTANTPNTIVKRDASGNLSAGTVTATTFSGSGAGLTNIPASAVATAPPGMVLIPAGTFTMGNSIGDGDITDATPIKTTVSAFYMDANLVSYSQWQAVYNYATANGYTFTHAGSGKGATHPVQTVDWYDCVKWCNARSQQAGRTPAYYTDAGLTTVYKTGEPGTIYVDWVVSGYRLPTEAEWEKAARG